LGHGKEILHTQFSKVQNVTISAKIVKCYFPFMRIGDVPYYIEKLREEVKKFQNSV